MGIGRLLSFVVLLFAQSDPAVDAARTKVQAMAQIAGRKGGADEENNLADLDQADDCTKITSRVKRMICENNQKVAEAALDKTPDKITPAELAADRKKFGRIRDANQKCEAVFHEPCTGNKDGAGYCVIWCRAENKEKSAQQACIDKCPDTCTKGRDEVWQAHTEERPPTDNRSPDHAIVNLLYAHLLKCICVNRQTPGVPDQSGCRTNTGNADDLDQGLDATQAWCTWGMGPNGVPTWRDEIVAKYKAHMTMEPPPLEEKLCSTTSPVPYDVYMRSQ